ncbi:hypothetical protein CWE14_00490 [Aliidiomarina soli]|uniref:Bacteriophage CI repressor N-terminal domain-containing protein n=2 Tax=Aliidiomarina soli TaxID=1928574 RepID=A0A432WL83_9GAMM|nr:hypothetical protein CWE14_00490 [Aliidiomarina soli]
MNSLEYKIMFKRKLMTNKTQAPSKSKVVEPTLDEYMERLSRLSGESKPAAILRWMGVSASSYSNWKRRGTIPYKTLVNVLIERRISLNWFFAPYAKLEVPVIRDATLQEGTQTYLQRQQLEKGSEREQVIKAYSDCRAILQRNNAQPSENNMRLMIDLYLAVGERVVQKEMVLEQLAQSLSTIDNNADDA